MAAQGEGRRQAGGWQQGWKDPRESPPRADSARGQALPVPCQVCSPSPLGTEGLLGSSGQPTLYNLFPPHSCQTGKNTGLEVRQTWAQTPCLYQPRILVVTQPLRASPSLNPTFGPSGLDPDRGLPPSLWISTAYGNSNYTVDFRWESISENAIWLKKKNSFWLSFPYNMIKLCFPPFLLKLCASDSVFLHINFSKQFLSSHRFWSVWNFSQDSSDAVWWAPLLPTVTCCVYEVWFCQVKYCAINFIKKMILLVSFSH